MRILQVTAFFSPVYGGSAEVPYNLSKELAKRGHEVILYTSDFKLRQEYIDRATKVKVHAFKTWLGFAGFHVTPSIMAAAKVETRHIDIIHLHNYRTFQNLVMHHYCMKYGVPYILQAHGSLPSMISKQGLKRVYDNLWGYRLLKNASRVIGVTTIEAEQYQDMGIEKHKIEIIPHGVDLSEFDKLPKRGEFKRKYSLGDDLRMILYLGRIHKIKGLDLLVKTFAGLAKAMNDIKLVIAGPDDGYLYHLKKLITKLGISDKVLFTGPLYEHEKLNAYVDAEVYVLPSVYEIFGITVLEACACGTPVIISDHCGIANVIGGQAGLVVPHDQDQLQNAILKLLNDDKMRERFGQKGKLLVREKFNWEQIAGQVERVYTEIL